MQGYLARKPGGLLKRSWKKRYYVLQGETLRSFTKEEDTSGGEEAAAEVWNVRRFDTVTETDRHARHGATFCLLSPELGPLFLSAESEEERKQWIQALSQHVGRERAKRTSSGGIADNRLRNALEYYNSSLRMKKKTIGSENPSVASTINSIAHILLLQGKIREAVQQFSLSLKIKRKKLADSNPSIAATMNSLGIALAQLGQHDEAVEIMQNALTRYEAIFGDSHPAVADVHNNLGETFRIMGNAELAHKHFSLATSLTPPHHAGAAATLHNSASLAADEGMLQDAAQRYSACIDLEHAMRQRVSISADAAADTLLNYAETQRLLGDTDEALKNSTKALKMMRMIRGGRHPSIAVAMRTVALCRLADSPSSLNESMVDLRECCEILRDAFGETDPRTADAFALMGFVLLRRGKNDEAGKPLHKASEAYRRQLERLAKDEKKARGKDKRREKERAPQPTVDSESSGESDSEADSDRGRVSSCDTPSATARRGSQALTSEESTPPPAKVPDDEERRTSGDTLGLPTSGGGALQRFSDKLPELQVADPGVEDERLIRRVAEALHGEGIAHLANGDYGAAISALRSSVEWFERLLSMNLPPPVHRNVRAVQAVAISNLAGALRATGKLQEATGKFQSSIAILREVPESLMWAQAALADTLFNYGVCCGCLADLHAAEDALSECMRIYEVVYGREGTHARTEAADLLMQIRGLGPVSRE